MNFASPEYLAALALLLPLSLGFLIAGIRSYRKRVDRIAHPAVRAYLLPDGLRQARWWQVVLQVLALSGIVLALARPRWDFQWREVKRRGSDIIVVLDLSQSMLASDVSPNRLEKARRSIQDLLGAVTADRLGLVLFAGAAFIQCPLTYDKAAFEIFLDQVSTDLLPVQGTAVAAALDLAGQALEEGSEGRGQTVILISDGEDHGPDALLAAKKLRERGAILYTLGVGGDSGAPVPMSDGGFLKDSSGQMVLTRPDRKALAALAEETGGRLLQEAAGDSLDGLYRSEIKSAGQEAEQSTREKLWNEEHMWLSATAALLLMMDLLRSLWPGLWPRRSSKISENIV